MARKSKDERGVCACMCLSVCACVNHKFTNKLLLWVMAYCDTFWVVSGKYEEGRERERGGGGRGKKKGGRES